MTADFRALCAELTDCLEKADWPLRHRYVFRQWIDIARAALADEPAVPEGREPVAVTEQPSDAEQVLRLAAIIREVDGNHSKGAAALAESILDHPGFRAVLAHWGNHVPVPPADGEVTELVEWLHTVVAAYKSCRNTDHIWSLSGNGVNARLTVTLLTRAAELLQRQVLPEAGE